MSSIHEQSKNFASYARKQNKLVEKLANLNPAFRQVKPELITLVGHA